MHPLASVSLSIATFSTLVRACEPLLVFSLLHYINDCIVTKSDFVNCANGGDCLGRGKQVEFSKSLLLADCRS